LLVATGIVLDAIEVGVGLGRLAAAALRTAGVPVPIVATPDGRWMFVTRTGRRIPAELAEVGAEVIHHGEGRFIPLPPSPYRHGVVHWRVKPRPGGLYLPEPEIVAEALREAVRTKEDLVSGTASSLALVGA
jgi:hypothetical protein